MNDPGPTNCQYHRFINNYWNFWLFLTFIFPFDMHYPGKRKSTVYFVRFLTRW